MHGCVLPDLTNWGTNIEEGGSCLNHPGACPLASPCSISVVLVRFAVRRNFRKKKPLGVDIFEVM